MIVVNATKLIAVDIDNTLATWEGDTYRANEGYITLIKQFHRRGHTLIAWSAGGPDWASRVVREFKLEKYFFAAMGKPDWFMDDKPSHEWLPEINRIFIPDSDASLLFSGDTKIKTISLTDSEMP